MLLPLIVALAPLALKVPLIQVVKIDYSQACRVTDSTQFYKNEDGSTRSAGGGGEYPEVEMDVTQPLGCPYVVNTRATSSITVLITFKNPLSREITGTWGCDYPDYTRDSCSPSDDSTPSISIGDDSIDLPSHGTQTVEMVVSGWDAIVQRGWLSFDLWCDCEPDDSGGGWFEEELYFTDSTPAGLMSTPWAEVLDDSCVWADGQSSKAGTMQHCTTGLYNAGIFTYSGSSCYHIVNDHPNTNLQFGFYDLTGLLSGSDDRGDCRDVSSFLSLCAGSQGYSGTLTQGWLPTGGAPNHYLFQTSDIQAIGTSGYASTPWNFHQFLEDSGYVYDACAAQAVDLSGASYHAPPWGSSWPRTDYWQKSDGSGDFWGLVRGYYNTSWHIPADVSTYTVFVPALTWGPGSGTAALLAGIK